MKNRPLLFIPSAVDLRYILCACFDLKMYKFVKSAVQEPNIFHVIDGMMHLVMPCLFPTKSYCKSSEHFGI